MKVCPGCGQNLPLSAYATDNSKANGHKSRCKSCDNQRSHEYYEQHRAEVIDRVTARRGQLDGWRGARRSSGRRRTRYSS